MNIDKEAIDNAIDFYMANLDLPHAKIAVSALREYGQQQRKRPNLIGFIILTLLFIIGIMMISFFIV